MQLVIIAGGKGTRLGLKDIPKPMCPINNKPLLQYQIELAKRYGIDEIFILSGHLSQVIVNYFGDGSQFGLKIHHVVEPHPLGTAGSLKLIEDQLTDRFLVFYGDVVMDFDISSFINFDSQDTNTLGTLLVHPGNHPYDSDLVEVNSHNDIIGFLPKPHPKELLYRNLNNAAVYILSPDILRFIPEDQNLDFGKDIFPKLVSEGYRLRAYDTAEFIRDMGTPDRLKVIEKEVVSGLVTSLNKENPRKAIFLDRDGTINENMDIHPSVKNFNLLPGVAEAIRKINETHYLAVVVTNQPMIAKGFLTFQELENIHKKMETLLGNERAYLDRIYFCPHHPEKGFAGELPELKVDCDCRKPKPGMLLQAARDLNIDLTNSWMIGDNLSDIEAGRRAGCNSILLNKDFNLLDAVEEILANDNH
jgi:mannose-1-phosphate guanylyltransferase/phosphomannomutase